MFKVNDKVKFLQSGLTAKGFLCVREDYDDTWIVRVIPSTMEYDGPKLGLHDCDGYFKESVGWFVNERNMELTSFTLDEILGLYV